MTIGCVVIPLLLIMAVGGGLFYLGKQAAAHLTVPANAVVFVRTVPHDTAPLLARFGAGRRLDIHGRTADWRWLEVVLWDGRHGWIRRPLDISVWRLDADPTTPIPLAVSTQVVSPIVETMVRIPATSFTMGSPPEQGDDDERPAHVVNLSAFAIDRTEVTVGQYWQCVAAGACQAPTRDASSTEAHYLNDPAFDNYPVINVPWQAANHYCLWRNKRLPSEAEWELAASWNVAKNAKLIWPWGNEAGQNRANVGPLARRGPAPVGSYPTDISPLGVMDMGGNVSEWVFDWYKVDYYRVAAVNNPIGPTHRRGAGTGRVVRGGAFADGLDEARASNRRYQAADYGYVTIGFRCAGKG
jgi:formylglycine-generating enzyme required for sulfatase activity